jgi:hypothetical protein
MAKKTTKSTAKATLAESLPGRLPKGDALLAYRAFVTRMMNSGATKLPDFAEAVCFTIAELRAYLDSAEKTISPDPLKPVPEKERGIAIVPAFRGDKVTISLVATRFSVNPLDGKISSINNVVTGIQYPQLDSAVKSAAVAKKTAKKANLMAGPVDPGEEQPPVGDDSYDNGSQYP